MTLTYLAPGVSVELSVGVEEEDLVCDGGALREVEGLEVRLTQQEGLREK